MKFYFHVNIGAVTYIFVSKNKVYGVAMKKRRGDVCYKERRDVIKRKFSIVVNLQEPLK